MSTKRDTTRHQFPAGWEAHLKAKHMARYSGKSWIAWHSRDDTRHFAQVSSAEAIKSALLEIGTGGQFFHYYKGHSFVETWRSGIRFIWQINRGYWKE